MTNSPNPGNEPEPTSGNEPQQPSTRSLRRVGRRRLGILLSVILLSVIGGGLAWAWFFVYRQLRPQVEQTVTKILNRPVQLGKLESFSFNSLRFGATQLPATPTDPDRASVEAVDVKFNLIPLISDRTLPLDVTLVKPNAYIAQDKDGVWVATKLQTLPKGAIDFKLKVLRLRNADVVLVPRGGAGNPKTPVALSVPSGKATFLNDNKLIQLDLGGKLASGGNFTIKGETRPSEGKTNLALTGSDLGASEIGRLIQLPLLLQAGSVDGNIELQQLPEQPLKFLGTATLKNVTARLPVLPQPFAKTNGQLRFKGTQVRLEKITTLFGQIPAQANGVVDTQSESNLSAQTQPVQLKQVLQTFNFKKLPVAVSGEVQAALRVTGPLNKPVISGEFATTKPTQIDRVNFRSISAGFGVVGSTLSVNNLQARPTFGGLVTGKGEIKLGSNGTVVFDAQATDVPGDAIAKNYRIQLPVPIGSVSGSTRIIAALDNPQNFRATGRGNLNLAGGTLRATNLQIDKNRFTALVEANGVLVERLAQVPPQLRGPLSGSFELSGPLASLTPSTIRGNGSGRLNVAGGTVRATNVQLRNGAFSAQVEASGVQVERLAQVPPQLQGPLSGSFSVSGPLASLTPSTIRGNGSGRLNVAGGTVTATDVQLNKGRFTAQVEASGVQVQRLAQVPPQVQGPLSGNFTLSGSLASLSPSTITARGSGSLNVAGGTVTATNVQLDKGRFTAQVRTSGVLVERLAQVPPQVQGPLSGNFTLSGSLASLSPSTITARGSGSLNVGGGTVTATNVQLDKGRFNAQVEANGVQVERLAQVPPQVQGPLSGNFSLSGSLASLSPSTITARGSGSLNVAGGSVIATNVQLDRGRFTAQVRTSGVLVERLAQVPPQVQGPLSGNFTLSGSLASLSPSTITARGSGSLNVSGGTVTATNVQLENGRFEAVVEPTGVQLAGFSQELRGSLGGRLNVSGSLAALSPAAIQARGQLNFSEGIALIDRSLTASINWNGQQLEIQQATANGFNANGVVNLNLANTGLEAISSFDLNVQAQDLNLQQLPATLPEAVQLAGRADFDGRIAGSPTAPNVNGRLELRNFVAGGLAFESPLRGSVSAVPGQGANLQLSGTRDQINVALAANYQPVSFLVQTEGAVASGRRQGELLLVNAQNFPIGIIKKLAPLPDAIATQPLSGLLSGDVAVNLNTYGISGDIAIADPIFGTLRGDSFIGAFQYANGIVSLRGGEFKQGDNQYLLSGTLTQSPNGPQFQARLDVAQGEIQTVLTALQIFDLSDLSRGFNAPSYGSSAEVPVTPAGLPQAPLETQLQRISEIQALLRQQQEQREASSRLPELSLAKGRFTGTVNVVGSLTSGVSAEFDIQGQNWEWGPYSANQVIAQGNFQDGVLSLLPLRFQSEDSLLSYTGTVGGDAQSGQLQLRNIPIAQLENVLNLPPAVGFTGLLNATATLAGSISNPQARGELTLTDATLNQTPVQSAQASFSYNNARLNFGSTLLIAETDPLSIGGSIPYKLPFASVKPANNQLALNIDVQNEGLALLNLLTRRQVTWVDGMGNVQVKVSGTYDQEADRPLQLVAEGIAAVENATLKATVLPEPLTNVTGRVLFDFDRIRVETVQGQFSGGTVTAAGTIPISQPTPQENPLSVNIGELALNLRGLYNGRVQGDVLVTGTALAPRIGGQVNLFNGQVQLTEAGAATGGVGGIGGESGSSNLTQFNGLQLTLGKGVQITRAPILDFLANGTLTLNGPLNGIRPEGKINLQRGQVNLFTTQFRLARGYESTAEFLPSRGLDPVLNVRLVALVTEATQRRLPTDPLSAEISDVPVNSFGSVRTVRIQAKVEGPASQLADNLELTSTPSRSEAEIVALLGGGFVDTLGRGDSTLGLANLAGSALLSNVQNIVGDALGLSEFRLFPTIITNDEKRTSALGLSAEAGVDISRNFSVSVLKELTNDQPFQYSLRYRLNEQTLLRGFTDLSGEGGAIVEYERRF